MPAPTESGDEVLVFIDLRSPYSYVATALLRALESDLGIRLRWMPFAIDIEATFGAAEARDPRQLAKTRYIYMDARRLAEPQGLVICGPTRIYDPDLAHRAMLFATETGLLSAYVDAVYERFFNRAIDIESRDEILGLIGELGGDSGAAAAFVDGPGVEALARCRALAEEHGIFGVPSMVYRGELFWGADRVEHLRVAMLRAGGR